jgi:hypothetical protein
MHSHSRKPLLMRSACCPQVLVPPCTAAAPVYCTDLPPEEPVFTVSSSPLQLAEAASPAGSNNTGACWPVGTSCQALWALQVAGNSSSPVMSNSSSSPVVSNSISIQAAGNSSISASALPDLLFSNLTSVLQWLTEEGVELQAMQAALAQLGVELLSLADAADAAQQPVATQVRHGMGVMGM